VLPKPLFCVVLPHSTVLIALFPNFGAVLTVKAKLVGGPESGENCYSEYEDRLYCSGLTRSGRILAPRSNAKPKSGQPKDDGDTYSYCGRRGVRKPIVVHVSFLGARGGDCFFGGTNTSPSAVTGRYST
jgi:hypothetical protein